jgi:hypothetical protein
MMIWGQPFSNRKMKMKILRVKEKKKSKVKGKSCSALPQGLLTVMGSLAVDSSQAHKTSLKDQFLS